MAIRVWRGCAGPCRTAGPGSTRRNDSRQGHAAGSVAARRSGAGAWSASSERGTPSRLGRGASSGAGRSALGAGSSAGIALGRAPTAAFDPGPRCWPPPANAFAATRSSAAGRRRCGRRRAALAPVLAAAGARAVPTALPSRMIVGQQPLDAPARSNACCRRCPESAGRP